MKDSLISIFHSHQTDTSVIHINPQPCHSTSNHHTLNTHRTMNYGFLTTKLDVFSAFINFTLNNDSDLRRRDSRLTHLWTLPLDEEFNTADNTRLLITRLSSDEFLICLQFPSNEGKSATARKGGVGVCHILSYEEYFGHISLPMFESLAMLSCHDVIPCFQELMEELSEEIDYIAEREGQVYFGDCEDYRCYEIECIPRNIKYFWLKTFGPHLCRSEVFNAKERKKSLESKSKQEIKGKNVKVDVSAAEKDTSASKVAGVKNRDAQISTQKTENIEEIGEVFNVYPALKPMSSKPPPLSLETSAEIEQHNRLIELRNKRASELKYENDEVNLLKKSIRGSPFGKNYAGTVKYT